MSAEYEYDDAMAGAGLIFALLITLAVGLFMITFTVSIVGAVL